MPDDHIEDISPHGRRRFFLEGLGRALGPVANYLEQKMPPSRPRIFLRPPGALPEEQFVETCRRCAACVDACPAGAIRLILDDADPDLAGTPYIDPDIAPCVICDAGACMETCPSGALQKVDRTDIAIGRAIVHHNNCLLPKGRECGVCVEKCPIGQDAIRLTDYGQVEVGNGCVGCGVCQNQCPPVPKAIVIEPLP